MSAAAIIAGEKPPNIPWEERPADGSAWDLDPEPFAFSSGSAAVGAFEWGCDPRLCRLGDWSFITWSDGFIYHFGEALLDLEDPSRVPRCAAPHFLAPQELCERAGDATVGYVRANSDA